MKLHFGKLGVAVGVGILMLAAVASVQATTEGVAGCWRTISDEDGKVKSQVCLWEKNGKLYGSIKELYNPEEPDPKCTKCTGWRKDKPIKGLMIVTGLKKSGDAWEGGYILDPKNGKTYKCKMWREGNKLRVRGYIGFLYRTQTWVK